MRWRTLLAATTIAMGVVLAGCTARRVTNQVDQGATGPTSPVESGIHSGEQYTPRPDEYKTAGLLPEYTNDKTDPTMEGSGNLAWQGTYEKEKREKKTQ